jgi:multidrug efflux pump subunit AcrB
MIAAGASTSASVPGVALLVAAFAALTLVAFEMQLAVRKSSAPSEPPPPRTEDPSYRSQLARIWYNGTYGGWIRYFRRFLIVVVVIALVVALVGWLIG